jgi:simple sugar transport system permease protein
MAKKVLTRIPKAEREESAFRRRLRVARHTLLPVVLMVVTTLLVLGAALSLAGYDAGLAGAALWRGAFGSWDAITSATLVRATPLIILALGFALALRGGALNIGGEGQFYAGAIAAAAVSAHVASLPAPLAVGATWVAAFAAGLIWISVPVLLKLRFGVLEAISTLLLNFVAEALVSWMVQGPLQEPTHIYPQSAALPESAVLPVLPGTRLHLGFGLALVLAGVLWFVFSRTRWGFQLRAASYEPRVVEIIARRNVGGMLAVALLVSGGISALAGAVEVGGVSRALYQNLSPGYGFTAIAVALLARLRPGAIILSGVFFGALEAGSAAMQRDAGVPAVIVYVVEAVVIITLLLIEARGWRRREALAGA